MVRLHMSVSAGEILWLPGIAADGTSYCQAPAECRFLDCLHKSILSSAGVIQSVSVLSLGSLDGGQRNHCVVSWPCSLQTWPACHVMQLVM